MLRGARKRIKREMADTTIEEHKDNKRIEDRTTTNDYPNHKTWVSQGGIRVEYGDQ